MLAIQSLFTYELVDWGYLRGYISLIFEIFWTNTLRQPQVSNLRHSISVIELTHSVFTARR